MKDFAENLVEDLLGDFEFEVQTPYLLYHTFVSVFAILRYSVKN